MDVYDDASRCHLLLLPTVPDVKLAAVANALEVGPAEASRVRSVVPVILWQCMEDWISVCCVFSCSAVHESSSRLPCELVSPTPPAWPASSLVRALQWH